VVVPLELRYSDFSSVIHILGCRARAVPASAECTTLSFFASGLKSNIRGVISFSTNIFGVLPIVSLGFSQISKSDPIVYMVGRLFYYFLFWSLKTFGFYHLK